MKKVMGSIVIILGLISGYMFFYAGNYLDRNGINMKQNLKSKGGESVAEYYYQDIGEMNCGLAGLCYAFGMGDTTISIGLGGILLTSPNRKKQIKNDEN
jgi:hypothetical protein